VQHIILGFNENLTGSNIYKISKNAISSYFYKLLIIKYLYLSLRFIKPH